MEAVLERKFHHAALLVDLHPVPLRELDLCAPVLSNEPRQPPRRDPSWPSCTGSTGIAKWTNAAVFVVADAESEVDDIEVCRAIPSVRIATEHSLVVKPLL